jgi:hypothetical protein
MYLALLLTIVRALFGNIDDYFSAIVYYRVLFVSKFCLNRTKLTNSNDLLTSLRFALYVVFIVKLHLAFWFMIAKS